MHKEHESPDETLTLSLRAFTLPIAKKICTGSLDPKSIYSKEDFVNLILSIGKTEGNAFQTHIKRFDDKIETIKLCLTSNAYDSAAALLFILLESEINQTIRIAMWIRGFEHSTITETLKGTQVKIKAKVLLPILGIHMEDRLISTFQELGKLRNNIVHCKNTPIIYSDEGTKEEDHSINLNNAKSFFKRTNLIKISESLENNDQIIFDSHPSIGEAEELVARFIDA